MISERIYYILVNGRIIVKRLSIKRLLIFIVAVSLTGLLFYILCYSDKTSFTDSARFMQAQTYFIETELKFRPLFSKNFDAILSLIQILRIHHTRNFLLFPACGSFGR